MRFAKCSVYKLFVLHRNSILRKKISLTKKKVFKKVLFNTKPHRFTK